eukprot:scaffold6107_cov130-Isochrysis_galbana.AAC.9
MSSLGAACAPAQQARGTTARERRGTGKEERRRRKANEGFAKARLPVLTVEFPLLLPCCLLPVACCLLLEGHDLLANGGENVRTAHGGRQGCGPVPGIRPQHSSNSRPRRNPAAAAARG